MKIQDASNKDANDLINTGMAENDIAIIGISCRFPGDVNNPEEFWQFLLAGGNGIVPVPEDRWENSAYYDVDKNKNNKMYVDRGGFIKAIDQFDPLFFGISPKEAPQIDPQHRWLLELTYEAFEHAGLKTSELKGSNTAVYIGQFMHDYEQLQLDSMAHHLISSHSATGPSMTLTANRISYSFDFTGPSVTLDTACSSSLVALDLACKALLSGDSALAIAGGVNILLRPELTMSICKASMLSPDGHCKSFDASANGYVRSEGAGLVIIKKLSDALRDGNRILSIIKATGVNQDGQTMGITVPNGQAQKKLLLQSLQKANIKPEQIHYAEAHGTGTAVGDPIEVNALGDVLGARTEASESCILGSVKSNIGHTEAAAGMAGLIKTLLAMNAGWIPKNIHYHKTNPAIDLKKLNLTIADKLTPWPNTKDDPRYAIVNSFGFGGTNANVILQKTPSKIFPERQELTKNNLRKLLPISAKTEKSLHNMAKKYRDYLEQKCTAKTFNREILGADPFGATYLNAQDFLQDICYSAANKREHLQHRLIVNGINTDDLIQAFDDFIAGVPSATYACAVKKNLVNQKKCFVFSGMGTQWAGMGKALYQAEPIFKAMLDRCDAALYPYTGWSLLDAIFQTDVTEKINDTCVAQLGIFSIQVALVEQLKSWQIFPDAIVGHSAGEVGAAYAAGALSFEDAIKVVYHRSSAQRTTEGMGRMLAVGLNQQALNHYLLGVEHKVSIGAINSEDAITLSGDADVLQAIAEKLEAKDFFARFLNVAVPYHSPVMEQLKEPLIAALQGIKVLTPRIPLFSTVSGKLTQSTDWGADYWADNVREPVLFKNAIENILATEITTFIEIAPHPALSNSIQKTSQKNNIDGLCIATLKREQNDAVMLMQTLATMAAQGIEISWDVFFPNGGNIVSLPNYAWQHASYWCEADTVKLARLKNTKVQNGFSERGHPLLGYQFNSSSQLWQCSLDLNEMTFLIDHQVENEIVFPGAGYIEMALAAAQQRISINTLILENIEFKKALFLDAKAPRIIETIFSDKKITAHNLTTFAINVATPQASTNQIAEWSTFCQGSIVTATNTSISPASTEGISIAALKSRLNNSYEKEEFYKHCHQLGLTYQDLFQPVVRAWFSDMESLVEIAIPDKLIASMDQYFLHPVLLDGAFQSLFPTIHQGYLPTKITSLRYYKKPDIKCFAYLETLFKDKERINGNIYILSTEGNVVVEVMGVELKSTKTLQNAQQENTIIYDYQWINEALSHSHTTEGLWIIFSDGQGVGEKLAVELQYRSQSVCVIEKSNKFQEISNLHYKIDSHSLENLADILGKQAKNVLGIVYLWDLEYKIDESQLASDIFEQSLNMVIAPVHIFKIISDIHWKHKQKLFFVTQSVQQLTFNEPLPNAIQGSLWGLVRVAASEYPEYNISLIDIPQDLNDDLIAQLAHQITHNQYEQEIALRNNQRYVNRLRRLIQDASSNELALQSDYIKSDRTYLITGGLGGLGLEVMDWLITLGAKSILLMGRSTPSAATLTRIQFAQTKEVVVKVAQGDVSQKEDLEHVFATIAKNMLPLAGIIHSAGVLDDGIIAQQSREKFQRVFLPKVQGAWNLHQLSMSLDLDFFICFSSIASVVGWAGQSNYAAANAFMDTLAHRRHALGKAALSINWGPWAESGMAANLDARDIQRMTDAGMTALTPAVGLDALSKLLISRVAQAGVFDLDWSKILKQYPEPQQKTLLSNFFVENSHEASSNFIDQWMTASPNEQKNILSNTIAEVLADVIGVDSANAIDKDKNVFDYGVNSLMSMDIKSRLQSIVKITLPSVLAFKYPTVNAMCGHITEMLRDKMLADQNSENEQEQELAVWDPAKPEAVNCHQVSGLLAMNISLTQWLIQGPRAHYNMGFVLEINDDKFDLEALKITLKILFSYHDGTRIRIYKEGMDESERYQQEIVTLDDDIELMQRDFRGMSIADAVAEITKSNQVLHQSFVFERECPLYRLAYYQLDDVKPHRLTMIFHHYISDAFSQKVIASFMESVYLKVLNRENVYLPEKNISLIELNSKIHEYANTQAENEIDDWLAILDKASSHKIKKEILSSRARAESDFKIVKVRLEEFYLKDIISLSKEKDFEFTDVAIHAVIGALSSLNNSLKLWTDFVIHARTDIFDGMDATQLLGLISESVPILFEVDSVQPSARQFQKIRKQRAQLKAGGLGFKALSLLNRKKDINNLFPLEDFPQVLINFTLVDYDNKSKSWYSLAKNELGQALDNMVVDDRPREFYINFTLEDGHIVIAISFYNDSFSETRVSNIAEEISNNIKSAYLQMTTVDNHTLVNEEQCE